MFDPLKTGFNRLFYKISYQRLHRDFELECGKEGWKIALELAWEVKILRVRDGGLNEIETYENNLNIGKEGRTSYPSRNWNLQFIPKG